MNQLKQIHTQTRKSLHNTKTHTILQLLELQNIPHAHKLFNSIPKPNTFLYNKLIQAYSSRNQPHQCFKLYFQMHLRNFPPNEHTFIAVFAACATAHSYPLVRILHTQLVKLGFHSDAYASSALLAAYAKLGFLVCSRQVFDEMPVRDVPTWNSLISGYCRAGDMEMALEIFRVMPFRNVVSWTAMISGYAQNGLYAKALEMYVKMEGRKGLKPNEVTIASVLPACANLGALDVGERIEGYARANGLLKNLFVSNALLEMYARCGKIDVAKRVFDEIGMRRNLCSWNSMVMGLAVHGRSDGALLLYDQMLRQGTKPDDITFVGLLLACTHGGMVVKGRHFFESMKNDFSIMPKVEHYGCMVDLLGRAGKLQEAYDLIKSMPMNPDSVIWGALLGACSFHKNVQFAEVAAQALFELEPWNPGNYIILSNIYASTGRWDGVAKIRKLMKGVRISKAAGYSLTEIRGEVHKFIVDDPSHPRWHEICTILNEISMSIKLRKTVDDFGAELELCEME